MEELDLKALLERFDKGGYKRGEQIILANFGTNQTLLTLIFNTPCNVHDIKMDETEGEINRTVNIRAESRDYEIVCQAESHIPIDRNRPDIVRQITDGQLGLGQIVVTNEIPNKRVLTKIGRHNKAFWRTYNIEGPGLYIVIREYFPREPFEKVGWIESEEV